MRFRYYLINKLGVKTKVDEPLGWDAFSLKIKRHPQRHGTFREVGSTQFKFIGTGHDILKAEHETYGVRGNYELLIQEKCGGTWTEIYRGKVSFETYKRTCENYCTVAISVDQLGPMVQFINRFDQKVDLSNPNSFDGIALTAYPGLSKTVTLPPKTILLRGISRTDTFPEFIMSQDPGWIASDARFTVLGADIQGALNIPFPVTTESTIHSYTPQTIHDFMTAYNSEFVPEVILNAPDYGNNPVDGDFHVKFRVKGSFKNLVAHGSGSHTLTIVLKRGTSTFYASSIVQTWTVYSGSNAVHTTPFDLSYDSTISLAIGELLWLNFFITYAKGSAFTEDVRLQLDPESNFFAEVKSVYPASETKLSLINETISRVIESITNNGLKLNSSYYGRPDSLPFSFPVGCGALKALTTGLDIRKAKLSDGTDPKMFLSMKDIFESLSAIDNIGIGEEGTDKIRMENWKYFYNENIVLKCSGINSIERAVKQDALISIFKNGYDKWEAEDFNGLDDFLTSREWRTSLSEVQNTLEKLSRFIASGYSWEVTRRKIGDSKDWRYDNDIFVVCLINAYKGSINITTVTDSFNIIPGPSSFTVGDNIQISGTVSNNGFYSILSITPIANSLQIFLNTNLVTEVAPNAVIKNLTHPLYAIEVDNITAPANMLDPKSVYNFRISPERNALRWFDWIAQCYRNITSADKLIFSKGEGNYIAAGLLTDTVCRLEEAVIAENADISLDSFSDPDDGTPINFPERVTYRFPLSFTEYSLIKADPYGLIDFECGDCEKGKGWIDEIEYFPEQGDAKFTLIPKIEA